MLLKMIDGGILSVKYDSDFWGGCETCDYGSSYINEFNIIMETGRIQIKVNQMYEYALSEDYMMKLILQNVDEIKSKTELEFYQWLKEKVPIDSKQYEWRDVEVQITFTKNK